MPVSKVSLTLDSKRMVAYSHPTNVHVSHSFSNRALPSPVTTPSTGTITGTTSLLLPHLHSSCSDWLKSLTPQDSSPIYGHTTHWRRGGGGALEHACHSLTPIHTNQCRRCEVTIVQCWVIHQLTKASTAALTSVYRHVTNKHTSGPFTCCCNNADIVMLCIYIHGSTWAFCSNSPPSDEVPQVQLADLQKFSLI